MRAAMLAMTALLAAVGVEAQQTIVHPRSRVVPTQPARATATTPERPAAESGSAGRNAAAPSFPFPCCSAYYYAYLPYGPVLTAYVQQPPPPPLPEARGPQPAPAMAWIPGFWAWSGAGFNWVEGRWALIPAPYTTWVAGYWAQSALGYYWVNGYWQ